MTSYRGPLIWSSKVYQCISDLCDTEALHSPVQEEDYGVFLTINEHMSKIVNCLIIILQRGNFSLQVLVYFYDTETFSAQFPD